MHGWLHGIVLMVLAAAACPAAFANGEMIYVRHCAACHGPAGAGAAGIPDLTDGVWQYGGSPEAIEYTIANGRRSTMPALGMALDEEGLNQMVAYVLGLSEAGSDPAAPEDVLGSRRMGSDPGESLFLMFCASCHGEDGQGTPSLGAPDLTDKAWLYGRDSATVRDVISNGRSNEMPAFADTLSAADIAALASFIKVFGEQ